MFLYEQENKRYLFNRIYSKLSIFRNLYVFRNLVIILLSLIGGFFAFFLLIDFLEFSHTKAILFLKFFIAFSFLVLLIYIFAVLIYFSGKRLYRIIKPYNIELYSRLLGVYELIFEKNDNYSRALIEDYTRRAEELISNIRLGRYLFPGRIKRIGISLIICLLILITISAFEYKGIKRIFSSVKTGTVKRAGVFIDVGKIKKEIFFPSYTNLESIIKYDDRRTIEAIKGSLVRIYVENKIGADYAQMILDNTNQNMKKEGLYFVGELNIVEDGFVRIDFSKRDLRYSSQDFKIKAIRDENPEIYLSGPEELLRGSISAKTDRKVSLSFSAIDDFGVSRINIVVSFADGKEKSFKIQDLVPPQKEMSGEYLWDYSELIRYVQGEIMFALEAEDNDTISGPKRNRTRFYKIQVPSSSENFTKDVSALKGLRGEMLHILALDLTYKDLYSYASQREKTGISQEALKNIEEFLNRRGKKDSIYREIQRVKIELNHFSSIILATVKRVIKQKGERPLAQLSSLISEETHMLERNVLVIQDIIDEVVYLVLSLLSSEISEIKNELKSLMNKYDETGDEELRVKITAVLSFLEKRIKEYRDIQSELFRTFSDVNINKAALKNLSQNTEALSKSIDKLKENLSRDELAEFRERLSELDNMISGMENDFSKMLMSLGSEKYKELMDSLNNLSGDIEKILNDERKVSTGLSRLEADIKKRYYDTIKSLLEKRLREIIELIERLNSDISKNAHIIKKKTRDMREYETAIEAQSLLNQMAELLKNQQIFDTLLIANQLVARMEWIKNIATMFNEDMDYKKMAENYYERSVDIRKRIKDIIGGSDQSLSKQEKKDLEQLLSSQERLASEMESVKTRSNKLLSEFGGNFQKLNDNINSANESMRLSSSSMKSKDVPLARTNADESISRLDDALKEISKMQSRRSKMLSQDEDGEGQQGIKRFKTAEVKLPKKEDFKPKEKLREEILKALKDEDIKGYEEYIRKYYEEILK